MKVPFRDLSDRCIAETRPYRQVVIFDYDGVLSDPRARLNLLDQTPPDWEGFFNRVGEDAVHHHNIWLMRVLLQAGIVVAICTGRPERTRQASMDWLRLVATAGFEDIFLYMRKDGDYRPDFEIKREMVADIRGRGLNIIMAFDDRKKVADMYIEEGIPCHLVDAGAPNMEQVAKYEKVKEYVSGEGTEPGKYILEEGAATAQSSS